MGVALEDGAVHERARVALVGVAAHVLLALGLRGGKRPLAAGREARAAAAAKAGTGHHVDDLGGGHLAQHLAQRLVAVEGNILVDVLRIDHAAVAQRDALLLFVELHVVQRLDAAGGFDGFLVQKAGHDAALDQVLGDDLVHVAYLDAAVERAFGVDDDHRADLAQAEATGAHQLDLVGQVVFGQQLFKPVMQKLGPG